NAELLGFERAARLPSRADIKYPANPIIDSKTGFKIAIATVLPKLFAKHVAFAHTRTCDSLLCNTQRKERSLWLCTSVLFSLPTRASATSRTRSNEAMPRSARPRKWA